MSRSILFAGICAIVAIAFATQRSSSSEKVSDRPLQITAAELRRATIIGDLGVPLGTQVTIEGHYQDMTYTKRKADDGRIVLVIESVDGKKLEKPVRFDTDKDWSGKKDGKRFKLVGCEWGEFTGTNVWHNYRGGAVAGVFRPFGYRSHFAKLRDPPRNLPGGNENTNGDRFGEE